MTIDYRLTVKCGTCYAVTTYTNERPDWHQWEPKLEDIAEAQSWMAEHGDETPKVFEIRIRPRYVTRSLMPLAYVLDIPQSYRYVTCPACDGEALPIDPVVEAEPDQQAQATA